jgi:hypothetical protein
LQHELGKEQNVGPPAVLEFGVVLFAWAGVEQLQAGKTSNQLDLPSVAIAAKPFAAVALAWGQCDAAAAAASVEATARKTFLHWAAQTAKALC